MSGVPSGGKGIFWQLSPGGEVCFWGKASSLSGTGELGLLRQYCRLIEVREVAGLTESLRWDGESLRES